MVVFFSLSLSLSLSLSVVGSSISILESAVKLFPSANTVTAPSRCSDVSAIWAPCICTLEMCIGWYPCGLKYCKGKPENALQNNGGALRAPSAIDYGNRHQYREHRMEQERWSGADYASSPQRPAPSWWLSLDLLLIWTLLPKATQWTSKNQYNISVSVPTVSNSGGRQTPTEAPATSSSSALIASACRLQHRPTNAGDQWSAKHKSPLPSPMYRCFPEHSHPLTATPSRSASEPAAETIREFNFTLKTPLPATVPLRLRKAAEVATRHHPPVAAANLPMFPFEKGFQFNEIIL
uniref:Out at first C-terminal domain-containing protein n=1 Tax=Anopheles maculatus TaxID=74869 RepID=A0A182S7F0_9DIPT